MELIIFYSSQKCDTIELAHLEIVFQIYEIYETLSQLKIAHGRGLVILIRKKLANIFHSNVSRAIFVYMGNSTVNCVTFVVIIRFPLRLQLFRVLQYCLDDMHISKKCTENVSESTVVFRVTESVA